MVALFASKQCEIGVAIYICRAFDWPAYRAPACTARQKNMRNNRTIVEVGLLWYMSGAVGSAGVPRGVRGQRHI